MLQSLIPNNQEGFPTSYVIPDAISPDLDVPDLNAVSQTIDYINTTPIVSGVPFWERLDCEPMDYYRMFKAYRDTNQRSLKQISKNSNLSPSIIHGISQMYHWQIRVQAFDSFAAQTLEAERTIAIAKMENKHKTAADTLFQIVLKEIQKWQDQGLLVTVSLKELTDLLDKAVRLERLSLGVPPDAPITSKDVEPIRNTINFNLKQNNINTSTPTTILSPDANISKLQQVLDVLVVNNALPNNTDIIDAEVEDEN